MNENLGAQSSQDGTPESRKPSLKKEGISPSSPQETPKSPETKERESAQRELKATREKVQRVVEAKRAEFGRSRSKRREGLGKEIKDKGLKNLLIMASEAIGKDKTSSEYELFQGLQIKPKDLNDPELIWVIAKTAELDGVSKIPDKLLMVALEATHRGGNSPLAKEFRKRLYQKLVELGEYEVYGQTVKEILKNIEDYPETAIGWYGAPDAEGKYDGDLEKKDIEMLAEKKTEESLRKVLRVKEEIEVEEKTAIQISAMEAKRSLEELSPELEEILEQLEQGELADKPEDLIRVAIQLRKFPQFAEDVRLGNVVSTISRFLVKLIEKEKKDKNFLARIKKAVQALYSEGAGFINKREWERFQLFFDKFPERELPDLLEAGGASGVTVPPTTEETFYDKLISLSLDPAHGVDPDDRVYQELLGVASQYLYYQKYPPSNPEEFRRILRKIGGVYARAATNDALGQWLDQFTETVNQSITDLTARIADIREKERVSLTGSLEVEDKEQIRENPLHWVRKMLALIEKRRYSLHGNELRNLVLKLHAGRDHILLHDAEYFSPYIRDRIDKIQEQVDREIHSRTHIHEIRVAMGTIKWETIIKEAEELGTHGLFYGFSVMDAGRAFNRYQFLIERKRIVHKEGKYEVERITPEVIKKLREEVEEELLFEFERLEKDEILRKDGVEGVNKRIEEIKASALLGYNLFVATQRQAWHVSQGEMFTREFEGGKEEKKVKGLPQWLSDPDTHIASLFAFLEFSVEKWSLLSTAEKQVLEEIMKYAGEGDRELGRRRLNRMLKVKDFFGSVWRHEPMYINVGRRYEDEAQNFLLGLRLRKAADEYMGASSNDIKVKKEEYKKVWEKIRIYRPLEMVKHFREEKDFADFLRGERFNLTIDGDQVTITNYCDLERYLGRFIYPIYEEVYKRVYKRQDMRHLRWDKLDTPEAENDRRMVEDIVRKMGGEPDQVIHLMKRLQLFGIRDTSADVFDKLERGEMEDHVVKKLIEDKKYEDIGEWTQFLDDALIPGWEDEIEIRDDDGNIVEKIDSVSSGLWLPEEGGKADAYPRILGDMFNASQAAKGMVGVMQSKIVKEFKENILEIASAMRKFAGSSVPSTLDIFAGGWFKMAKAYAFYNWFGLSGLSIMDTSRLQKLSGKQASSLNLREIRSAVEELDLIMGRLDIEGGEELKLGTKLRKQLGVTNFWLFLFQTRPVFVLFLIASIEELKEKINEEK